MRTIKWALRLCRSIFGRCFAWSTAYCAYFETLVEMLALSVMQAVASAEGRVIVSVWCEVNPVWGKIQVSKAAEKESWHCSIEDLLWKCGQLTSSVCACMCRLCYRCILLRFSPKQELPFVHCSLSLILHLSIMCREVTMFPSLRRNGNSVIHRVNGRGWGLWHPPPQPRSPAKRAQVAVMFL